MNLPEAQTTAQTLNAEALVLKLREGVRGLLKPGGVIVGIWRGGAWLAERLQRELALPGGEQGHGVISSTLHRDDFGSRGLARSDATRLPFDINGRHVVLIDDVLYTGRTIRAVVNELYDYGRPASVQLAVLVDRGGRELPVAAAYAAATVRLHSSQRLSLVRGDNTGAGAKLSFALQGASAESE